MPLWRNWQTRQTQNLLPATEWEFESPRGHQSCRTSSRPHAACHWRVAIASQGGLGVAAMNGDGANSRERPTALSLLRRACEAAGVAVQALWERIRDGVSVGPALGHPFGARRVLPLDYCQIFRLLTPPPFGCRPRGNKSAAVRGVVFAIYILEIREGAGAGPRRIAFDNHLAKIRS